MGCTKSVAASYHASSPRRLARLRPSRAVSSLPGPDGPLLLELELTEPYLFLGMADGAADRFAAAILRWP